jgi:hypothetical protein
MCPSDTPKGDPSDEQRQSDGRSTEDDAYSDEIGRRSVLKSVGLSLAPAIGIQGAVRADPSSESHRELQPTPTSRFQTWNDSGGPIGIRPSIGFERPVSLDSEFTFEYENRTTGFSQTVVILDGAVEATVVALDTHWLGKPGYGDSLPCVTAITPNGDIRRLPARAYQFGGEPHELPAAWGVRHTYQITVYRDGTELGATAPFEMTAVHSRDFQQVAGPDTIEYSFAAGSLPTDGRLDAWILTDDGPKPCRQVGYLESGHRFAASIDTADVPPGEHRAVLNVPAPGTEQLGMTLHARLDAHRPVVKESRLEETSRSMPRRSGEETATTSQATLSDCC